jgi:hypothetical protein
MEEVTCSVDRRIVCHFVVFLQLVPREIDACIKKRVLFVYSFLSIKMVQRKLHRRKSLPNRAMMASDGVALKLLRKLLERLQEKIDLLKLLPFFDRQGIFSKLSSAQRTNSY